MKRTLPVILLLAAPLLAAGEEFIAGRVIESVACLADAEQSYALYVPGGYRPERPWPIIFCFDPGGRGAVPVRLFHEAAEKFGYILVGSNNSRNGPWEVVYRAARACWRDAHARFSIDDRRICTAGFSGGARAACGMGKMLAVTLAGVIGCGAGLPEWLPPEDFAPVPWFGTAGLSDFNFAELQELEERLGALGSPRHLETFPGGHSWPPPELVRAALQWLELQAMEKGLRPADEALIDSWLESAMAKAGELEAAGEMGQAYGEYVKIARDFAPYPGAARAGERASLLGRSQPVKKYVRAEAGREDEYASRLLRLKQAYSLLSGPLAEPGAGRRIIAQLKIASLKKEAEKAGNGPQRIVAGRLLSELFVQAAGDGDKYLESRDGPRALIAFQILAEIKPAHPGVAYGLASARALSGERKKALKGLAAAVALGFADHEALASDPAWEHLREDPEFKEILASLRKAP
jgi:dienelactone hydrolase